VACWAFSRIFSAISRWGELLALIEAAAGEEESGLLGPAELVAAARDAGITSRGSSTSLIRRMREDRNVARRG
jgi:hypothetical protein